MPAIATGFAITRYQQGTTVWVRVLGELDLVTSPQLRAVCAREQRDGTGIILVDLAHVTFMDSAGLHALIGAAENDEAQRLRIMLGAPAARIIDIVKARDKLPIIEG